MTNIIYLPSQFKIENMEGMSTFFNAIDDASTLNIPIVINFSTLSWIDPFCYTSLFNKLRDLQTKNIPFLMEGYLPSQEPIKYIDDCGFFEFFTGKPLPRLFAGQRQTTYSHILSPSEKSIWYESDLSNWLTNTTKLSSSSFGSLQVCLFELFSNIQDHSGADKGAFFAQYYPHKNQLIISISDLGVGIPTTVRRKLPLVSDAECLEKACQVGFTVGSTSGNRGYGLDNLLNTVVGHCNGTVRIISLSGYYEIFENYSKVNKNDLKWSYPGTSIEIVIDTTKLPNDPPEEEDFEW